MQRRKVIYHLIPAIGTTSLRFASIHRMETDADEWTMQSIRAPEELLNSTIERNSFVK